MKNVRITQDVAASLWNAATVLLTPLTASSTPRVLLSCCSSCLFSLLLSRVQLLPHSTYLGTEAMTQLTDIRHVTAFIGSAKLGDLLTSSFLQCQNAGHHLFSSLYFT